MLTVLAGANVLQSVVLLVVRMIKAAVILIWWSIGVLGECVQIGRNSC